MTFLWNKQQVGQLLIHAAQYALAAQESVIVREKGIEKDLYTDADVGVEKLFIKAFDNPNNGQYLIGEETVFQYIKGKLLSDIFSSTAFVVDPIDGTLNYFNKLPSWAVSIGMVRNGEIVDGAVILPELRELFISDNGKVYYKKFSSGIEHIGVSENIVFEQLQNASVRSHGKHSLFVCSYPGQIHDIRTPYHVNRSSVYSATKVLTGHYWGYVSKAKIWDLAGCIGLFRAMNKSLYYVDGRQLKTLPFTISEDHWANLLSAQYDIIFAQSKEDAQKFIKDA